MMLPVINDLFDELDDIYFAVEHISPLVPHLPIMDEEARMVRTAVTKRQMEFAAGRYCARLALRRLNVPDAPLLSSLDRTPIWPFNITGSISHTDNYCIAAVAHKAQVASIGIDTERNLPLDQDLWRMVCTSNERIWLNAQPTYERGKLARLFFSAKECVYKCQYQLTHQFLDFHDVEIHIDLAKRTFAAELHSTQRTGFPSGIKLHGRLLVTQDLILAIIVLRRVLS